MPRFIERVLGFRRAPKPCVRDVVFYDADGRFTVRLHVRNEKSRFACGNGPGLLPRRMRTEELMVRLEGEHGTWVQLLPTADSKHELRAPKMLLVGDHMPVGHLYYLRVEEHSERNQSDPKPPELLGPEPRRDALPPGDGPRALPDRHR